MLAYATRVCAGFRHPQEGPILGTEPPSDSDPPPNPEIPLSIVPPTQLATDHVLSHTISLTFAIGQGLVGVIVSRLVGKYELNRSRPARAPPYAKSKPTAPKEAAVVKEGQ